MKVDTTPFVSGMGRHEHGLRGINMDIGMMVGPTTSVFHMAVDLGMSMIMGMDWGMDSGIDMGMMLRAATLVFGMGVDLGIGLGMALGMDTDSSSGKGLKLETSPGHGHRHGHTAGDKLLSFWQKRITEHFRAGSVSLDNVNLTHIHLLGLGFAKF